MRKRLLLKPIRITVLFIVLTFIMGMIPASPEEGMYPLSEIDKVDLVKAGLKIDPKEVYNPDGISLIDALVNVGGCTGSFISDKGLIITNHHCAYGSIARASTVEKNYLQNGFHAASLEEEIPALGNSCRILESYQDVSAEILDAVKNITDPSLRAQTIAKKSREIAGAAANEEESIVADVSEMFAGKTYVLFKYRVIRDVRLVYAPPQSIGNFGGETDNWVWPRHTGDFSLLRAYVAPDGKAATYSKENVPFRPKKFLKVNPDGVEENDFVFILGYPGRTFRHRPSQYIKYQQDYLLPYISETYDYAIKTLQEISKGDKELELAVASRIKGLANTMKNYKGKLKGLKKINLVAQKEAEDKLLNDFINSNPELKKTYGNLLDQINQVFVSVNDNAEADLWFRQAISMSPTISLGNFILNHAEEMQKPENERSTQYQEKNLKQTINRAVGSFTSQNAKFEQIMLAKLINDAGTFTSTSRIKALDQLFASSNYSTQTISDFIDNTILASKIRDTEYFNSLLTKTPDELISLNDPFINLVYELRNQNLALIKLNERNEGQLNKLYGDLVDVKIVWKKTNFIPDANSTLRLTYGYIKGYSPADATYMEPFTTIDGIIEKNATGGEEFAIPDKLRSLYDSKDFGRYLSKKRNNLPIAMLYNMDTTGGNSGSPILDAYGRLIGVNFDRAFEATINDFAWNESYSRSIGVDIRYVLWVLDKFSGAKNILSEIGI
ncbi:MAG TPA: S46 family peptidase [Melioribacteraceae bacterium]|nr:S46 family peptidase [Melioribacteraceae bacterium]